MTLLLEFIKFLIFAILLVIISKYALVWVLRKIGDTLNLKSSTVGTLTGAATSTPELLSTCFTATAGLISTSIYNILSSNIINLILYFFSVIINKNIKFIKDRIILIDIVMSIITITIPLFLVINNIEISFTIVPTFILLLILFMTINSYIHENFFKKKDRSLIRFLKRFQKRDLKVVKYFIYLFGILFILFICANQLTNALEIICITFKVPELLMGVLLGVITSIPELITFIESQRYYDREHAYDGVVEATNNLFTSNVMNLFVIQTLGIILFMISN